MRISQMLTKMGIEFKQGGRGFKKDEWHFELSIQQPNETIVYYTFSFKEEKGWAMVETSERITAQYMRPQFWMKLTDTRVKEMIAKWAHMHGLTSGSYLDVHEEVKPPVQIGCPRCNGKGVLTHYGHVYAGVCFKCWGSGDNKNPYSKQIVDAVLPAK